MTGLQLGLLLSKLWLCSTLIKRVGAFDEMVLAAPTWILTIALISASQEESTKDPFVFELETDQGTHACAASPTAFTGPVDLGRQFDFGHSSSMSVEEGCNICID